MPDERFESGPPPGPGPGPEADTAENENELENDLEHEHEHVLEEAGRGFTRRGRGDGQNGFYFYGVVRTRGWRGHEGDEVLRVRYRDLDALVRAVPFKLPAMDAAHVQAHQRVVEAVLRRATILPAPYGVIFKGRRALVRFLEDQYLSLDEGLAFLEGHWELRVHATPRGAEETSAELEELAIQVYAELRRTARAAIPFPHEGRRLLSAAFLVERGAWIEFVNRAEDLVGAQPLLAFDITGPWPPYDFVRMSA